MSVMPPLTHRPGNDDFPPWTWNPLLTFYRFWTRPIRAEGLALFRILLGSVMLLSMSTSLIGNFNLYLGPDGLCPPDSLESWLKRTNRWSLAVGLMSLPPKDAVQSPAGRLVAGWLPGSLAAHWEQLGQHWQEWARQPSSTWFLLWLWFAVCSMMTLGLFTRLATIATWILSVSFDHRLTWLTNGGDTLARVALFYLMFAPAGAVWSLDHWWRRAREKRWCERMGAPLLNGPVFIAPWTVRLLQIQFVCVYCFTGLAKAVVDIDSLLCWQAGTEWYDVRWFKNDWINGQAVYWVLNDLTLTRWPYDCLPMPKWLIMALSWGTLVFEIGFPIFIIFRWTRPIVLLGGLLFHLGILLHVEVGWFSAVTMSWYPLFLSGPFLERLVRGFVRG